MTTVGRVEAVWRYPVKSMQGEELSEAFVGFSGVYGDRLYAFRSSRAPVGFPYLTARELGAMLQYRPRFRNATQAAKPPNQDAAEGLAPGVTPVYAQPDDLAIDVETPSGALLAIDDPALLRRLQDEVGGDHVLTLLRSDRAMTDCRPVSLISVQTARQLGEETGLSLDKRRFRANVYLDVANVKGFAEDAFVGKTLRIGPKVTVTVLERDPRCKMITLDPDTAEAAPPVMKTLAAAHDSKAGVYAAVLVEGTIRRGDEISVLS
jgi:uncharacterized protein YcbX